MGNESTNVTAAEPISSTLLDELPELRVLSPEPAAAATPHSDEVTESQPEQEAAATDVVDAQVTDEEADLENEETEVSEADVPKTIRKLLKRVDKLTARTKASEEENNRLRQMLDGKAQAPAAVGPAVPSDPLANVWSAEELQKTQSEAEFWEEWAERHEDGGQVALADGTTREFTADEVKVLARDCRRLVRECGKRSTFIQSVARGEQLAQQLAPEFFEKDSDANKEIIAVLADNPEFAKRDDVTLRAVVFALGKRALKDLADKKLAPKKTEATPAATMPKTQVPLAPPVPKSSAARPPAAAATRKNNTLDALLEAGGSAEALERILVGE